MKRICNIYNKICDLDTIMNMYDNNIRKTTKNKKKIQRFDDFYSCNMLKIRETLINKNYRPQKYNIFLVYKPKLRIIMSQEIEDKIINHLVTKYFLIDVFDKSMLNRNCATRIGKGTHYALKLIDTIIDSTNEDYINNEKKKILNTNVLDKQKRLNDIDNLSLYKKGKGVCIANVVSQIIATFYLDELDKYIEQELEVKAHTRYMDDFYCMSESKENLKRCLVKIQKF